MFKKFLKAFKSEPVEIRETMLELDKLIILLEEKNTISENSTEKLTNYDFNSKSILEWLIKTIKEMIEEDNSWFVSMIKTQFGIREWIFIKISRISWDALVTWRYNLHRGILNNLNWWTALLKIHDMANDELVAMKAITKKDSDWEKQNLLDLINQVG